MIVPRFAPSTSLPTAVLTSVRALLSRNSCTEQYEQLIRSFFGKQYVLLFPQARIALYAIVRALLPKGAEVIVSAYNVPVVIEYLQSAGARLRYVDVEEGGFNLDIAKIIQAIGDDTKAVVISHMYGKGADFGELLPICRDRRILIIEDAAQAFGSLLESPDPAMSGELCGTAGDVGVFSTGIYKKFSTVLGGFVLTDDREIFEKLAAFKREHSESRAGGAPIVRAMIDGFQFIVASNRLLFPLVFLLFGDSIRKLNLADDKKRGRIDPDRLPYTLFERFQSRLGIDSFAAHERTDAPFIDHTATLRRRFGDEPLPDGPSFGYLHYPVAVPDRSEAIAKANALGYDLGPGKFFNYAQQPCPHADRAVRENLSIPLHRFVSEDKLERIADIVEAQQRASR